MTGAGEYIELFRKTEDIVYNDVRFVTCFSDEMDNIVCQGQIICVSEIEYLYSIEMLVCAEWGACEDSIAFCFECSSKEEFELSKKIKMCKLDFSRHFYTDFYTV